MFKKIKDFLFSTVPIPISIVLAATICIGILSANVIYQHREKAVSNAGRVRDVSEQLRGAEQAQQDIKNSADDIEQGIRRSERTADEVTGRVENAQRAVSEAQTANDRAGELIESCQRILRAVHERGTQDKAEN